ncbi:MAG: galactosyldiacylglycerol synthase [Synergistaceae bacterium]|nr:galactosyldiacylglycerol synthase [Synergistaceae bacterium]
MKSIAFLYASEGTGHKAAAENLREWFLEENRGNTALCLDVLEVLPFWMRAFVSKGYLLTARQAPWIWGRFYWGSDKPSLQASIFDKIHLLLCRLYLPKIEKLVSESGAETVVFTHYFGASIFAERNRLKIPVFYVNTDFVTHRFQRSPLFSASFVASESALEQYKADGIHNVFNTGIPVSKKYSAPISKEISREHLGLDETKITVLVTGGGIGAGPVAAIVSSLVKEKDIQTVVICGNNASLYKKLSSKYDGMENVRVKSFVDNMHEYYSASDLALMKPGGLSLSEALSSKMPLLLMEPVPGQEQLNMDFLCNSKAARRLKNNGDAVKEALEILENKKVLEEILSGTEKLARPCAAANILEIIKNIK